MKVLIDIPEEFEDDYQTDRFKDFFDRAIADMDVMCGKYERETAEMLSRIFRRSIPYDLDSVVSELKKKREEQVDMYMQTGRDEHILAMAAYAYSEEIVKGGIV